MEKARKQREKLKKENSHLLTHKGQWEWETTNLKYRIEQLRGEIDWSQIEII